ncbi:hypothetical protein ABBQ32_002073 [Trebouxia sp. C0010 RCD-2024]
MTAGSATEQHSHVNKEGDRVDVPKPGVPAVQPQHMADMQHADTTKQATQQHHAAQQNANQSQRHASVDGNEIKVPSKSLNMMHIYLRPTTQTTSSTLETYYRSYTNM